MHNFLAGFMGFFVGVTSMFHGGATPPPMNHTPSTQQANVSGTPASPSGMMYANRKGDREGMNLPQGERPFFGTVTNVNGSVLTVQMQGMMFRPMMRHPQTTITPTLTLTPPAPRSITVDLTSSTTYTGGTQSDITTNTKVSGVGTSNSDGSITAIKIQINPTPPAMPSGMPSGFPHRPMNDQ